MVNLNKKYPFDVVMVGCGIANIMCALKIIENKPDTKILMIERGNKLEKRGCPKSVTNNECVHCQPCQITSGFAGAGCFSDTKLTYSPEVGGTLIDYVGESEFIRLINESDELFTKYGGKNDSFFNDDFANKFSYDCQKYGMRLIKSKTRHLGTDGSYSVMMNIYSKLLSYNNVHILCNTDVVDIDFNKHKITCVKNSDEAYFYYKYLSVGVGRYGADWLREICIKNGIQTINDAVDVVLESGKASTSFLQRKLSVGYSRGSKIMDQMEDKGIIGPAEGAKPRKILINKQQWIQIQAKGPVDEFTAENTEQMTFASDADVIDNQDNYDLYE